VSKVTIPLCPLAEDKTEPTEPEWNPGDLSPDKSGSGKAKPVYVLRWPGGREHGFFSGPENKKL